MQRLPQINPPEGKAQTLLDGVKKTMGSTPNLFTTFANAPAALEAYLGILNALRHGVLAPRLREQVAVTVAGYNGCSYCASAHVFLGVKAGVERAELIANLQGRATDPKTQAALDFARALLDKRGKVSEDDLGAVRHAGFSDEDVIEILAHVAMNTFTNYFNEAFKVEVDFPLVTLDQTREAA